MIFISFIFFSFSFSYVYSFKNLNIRKRNMLNMLIDENNAIDFINKYKFYFDKQQNVNDLFESINNKKITDIFIDSNYKDIITFDKIIDNENNINNIYDNYHIIHSHPLITQKLVNEALEHNIYTHFINFNGYQNTFFTNFLITFMSNIVFIIPILLFIYLYNLRKNNSQGVNTDNTGGLFNFFDNFNNPFGQEPESNQNFKNQNVSLTSWAGSPEVIDEVKDLIDYVKNKKLYEKYGAEMPKGILLEGPPGTGKTMLAKAISSETNYTFISTSGSEFVEVYVGLGASKIRKLFVDARKNTPCIIFIDEIDAVGKKRGNGINTNDEREQTLNQLLYEMDGFKSNEDIIIMAATNRKDVLDPALLRPGRFDKSIRIPLPDKLSRKKILEYYFTKKEIEKNVDIESLSELTDGFSGAELKNLVNEATIMTAKRNGTKIHENDIFKSFEKSIVGLIYNDNSTSIEVKKRVSIHESGHALLGLYFNKYFDVLKISIQPTYNGAGGYTLITDKPDAKNNGLYTKDILKKRLIMMLGGKAAEYIFYGDNHVSLGATEDLKQSNALAQQMIGNFGMGNMTEIFYNNELNNEILGSKYSDFTKRNFDIETLELLKEAYCEAKKILEKNKDKLLELSEILTNKNIVYKKDLNNFISSLNF